MIHLRLFLITILVVGLTAPPVSAAVNNAEDLAGDGIVANMLRSQLPRPFIQEDPNNFQYLQVGQAFNGGQDAISSQVSHVQTSPLESSSSTITCEGYDDPDCANQQKSADILLPVCDNSVVGPCIEGLTIGRQGSNSVGSFNRYVNNFVSEDLKTYIQDTFLTPSQTIADDGFQDTLTWDGDPTRNLPKASSPSLWTVNGANNLAGENTYMVRVRVSFLYNDNEAPFFNDLSAEVVPFKEISRDASSPVSFSDFHPPVWYTRNDSDPDSDPNTSDAKSESFPSSASHPLASFDNPGAVDPVVCAYEEMGKCGVALAFNSDDRIQVSLRIPKALGGWFHGRLSDTNVDLSEYNQELNKLVIAAKPVIVPTASLQFEPCKPGNENFGLKFFYDDALELQKFCDRELSERNGPEPLGLGSWGQWAAGSSRAVESFTDFESLISEQAKGQLSMWTFGSLPFETTEGSCFSDTSKVQGVISTNAMVYQAGIPTLTNKGFSYRIAGTHLNMNGEVFRGDYTLEMRSDLARCLYSLGDKKFKADVKVSAATGDSKPSVTTFEESDGWIRLTAKDFSFSETSIDMALTPEASVVAPKQPVQTLKLIKKSKTSVKSIATEAGLSPSKRAVVKIAILNSSKKICKVIGKNLVALKSGNCNIRISVQEPKPSAISFSEEFVSSVRTKLSKAELAQRAGKMYPKNAKASIYVYPESNKNCQVRSGKLDVIGGKKCHYKLTLFLPRPGLVKKQTTFLIN